LHIPNGKPDGVKIIPSARWPPKTPSLGIKDMTRDDMLSAHRVPPQLLGIVPKNGRLWQRHRRGQILLPPRNRADPAAHGRGQRLAGLRGRRLQEPDDITALLASVAPGAAK
jgi:hypothetical protein